MGQNLGLAKLELKEPVNGDAKNLQLALTFKKIINSNQEDLKQVLRFIMVKIGLRAQNWPNDDEKTILIQHIIKNYGGHTTEEIKLAFDMAIEGKLDVEVNCYENFSCLYFSNIMSAYRQWSKEEYKQLPVSIPTMIENKEDMSKDAMLDWFNEVAQKIRDGKMLLEFVPPMLYEFMDDNGNITKTAKEKREYLSRAVEYRYGKLMEAVQKEDSMANQLVFRNFSKMRESGCFEGDEITKLKTIAKQIILFELVINN